MKCNNTNSKDLDKSFHRNLVPLQIKVITCAVTSKEQNKFES